MIEPDDPRVIALVTGHPEELIDSNGGLRVPKPVKSPPHACELPSARDCGDLLAYRAPCGHWWWPKYVIDDFSADWGWRRVGRFRRWRWRKILPKD